MLKKTSRLNNSLKRPGKKRIAAMNDANYLARLELELILFWSQVIKAS